MTTSGGAQFACNWVPNYYLQFPLRTYILELRL